MMKRGKHIIRSYMTLDYEFAGIRIQDGFLSPVDWELKIKLIGTEKKNKSREESEFNSAAAYQKLYFWLDTNLPNIAIVNVEEEEDLYIANLSSNIMMYCPGSSGDEMIVQLLHAKLSTLANGNLIIGEISLKSSDSTMSYIFDSVEEEYSLPLTTSEYYTEGTARDQLPWWFRDDGFCFEFIRPDKTELSDEELFKDIADPLDEFNRIMSETEELQMGKVKEPARIVPIEKWKPRKVE